MAIYNHGAFGPTAATDDLGRSLPIGTHGVQQHANSAANDRKVGMFYFLWCGSHSSDKRPLDVTKLINADPKAGYRPEAEEWGPYSAMHHWGEPLFGYYYSQDEWVMRKHIEMLTHADIDFLVFDTTNAVIYEEQAKMMLRLLSEYRAAGFNTPQAMFYTNTRSGYTAQLIYDSIYKTGYMSDSWFCVDGKPLIIAIESECSPEVRDFFTIKMSQWPNEATKLGGWPWMDFERPQRVFRNLDGQEEIINVSVAQHPQIHFGDSALYGEDANCGRSFHNGANDRSEGAWKHGYNFAEQWERAIETAPPYVFVTGWNEWIAGRWTGTPARPLSFVDCADLEFSRDIEPMRGGYFDNYYMQLISYVRRYKGCEQPIRQTKHITATIEDTFDRMYVTDIVYRDFPNGAYTRDCIGYNTHYTDSSGRNEIIEARCAHDNGKLYFYARTASDITRYDYASTWMTLFLNVTLVTRNSNDDNDAVPCDKRWKGYNYIANTYQFTDSRTALSACIDDDSRTLEADTFRECAVLNYKFAGNEMLIEIPKRAVGLKADDLFRIDFKWADSRERITRMEDFYTSGDAAPIGRLNYIFMN